MTKALYAKAKQKFLSGAIDLTSVAVKAVLVDEAEYTYDNAHEFLSSIPAAARVAISDALGGKSVTDGVFDADDVEFVGLTGASIEAVALFVDTGDAATSSLLSYVNEGDFPVTPSGGDVTFRWDDGASKIFAL